MSETEKYLAWIGGTLTAGASEDWMEDRNPADVGDVVALFPAMQRSDVENAVNAAARAFPAWRAADWVKRGEFLKRTAQLLRERAESIARDLAREMGKTLREARTEVVKAADFFEYYGSLGRLPVGNLLPDARAGVTTISTREPLGVVVAITPWNDPLLTPARKLAPALVAGNTVILKPSSLTPLSAWHLIKALHDAGVSDGVANLVTGSGSSLVETLVGHPEVRAVTFTGSTEVGLQLQKMAAGRNIRVQTEMGGKNALVVLRDANLDLAADLAVTGAFAQAGQRCTATSRIIVEDAVHDPFLEKMAERTKAMRIGPGLDERTDMGPVVDQGQLDTVLEFVEGACREGASLAVGGRRLTGEPYDRGYFVEPTIFTDVQPSMTIAQKEVFGPVVAVMRVGSFDEAVEVVNGTRYGLSASVVTRSLESAHRFAAEVDVGCVGVNVPTAGWDVHISFGGFKDSGSAFREQGLEALQFYTRVKSVAMQVMGI